MDGLTGINVELTSRCNKECWCCGRRKLEKENPELCNWGDMPLEMVRHIADTVSGIGLGRIAVQLHNNGEPLLYPYLTEAISCFKRNFIGFNTNAKLLLDKAADIVHLDSLTISIIENDTEGESQLMAVQSYLEMDIPKPKLIVFRMLGRVDRLASYMMLANEHNCLIAFRQLHAAEGSFDYECACTIPEMGVCLEALHKLSIDRYGNVSPCVRFDPQGEHIIGNLTSDTLPGIWYGEKRAEFLQHHLAGNRHLASPVCASCSYWGIPRG